MTDDGTVLSIYRWPVKSMGGETLSSAVFDHLGVIGDRAIAITGDSVGESPYLTARRNRWLLGWRAGFDGKALPPDPTWPMITGPNGVGMRPDDPDLLAVLEEEAGFPIELRSEPQRHPDIPGYVHLTFEVSRRELAAELGMDLDIRRFRPNLHLDIEMAPFEEETWIGRTLVFTEGLSVEIVKSTERCAIPTNNPTTRERSPELLRHLRRAHALKFGVYCRVIDPAPVETGAPFEFG